MLNLNFNRLIHPDGWKFVAIFAAVSFLLAMISSVLGWIGAVLTLWCFYFFRNPERQVPQKEGLVLASADGVVCAIEKVLPPEELDIGKKKVIRVSTFLNIFDVHVNRVPIAGKIEKIIYHEGEFLNASLDKASDKNERNSIVLVTPKKQKIVFVQIAGLIARRIQCAINAGDEVKSGSVFGLIRFGSRVDVYLPEGAEPLVGIGQRMIAGETILCDLTAPNLSYSFETL